MTQYFLIIGAMKAGTSSLYHDLGNLDGVFMTPEKEPDDLASEEVLTEAGTKAYLAKFSGARSGDICGEASTSYSKLPIIKGVPERAVKVLGKNLKIIYVQRDPIARIISQYKHLWGLGLETRPMNRAVLEDPSYVATSQYEYQLEAWRKLLPPDQILILEFEEYIANPGAVLSKVATFLDVDAPKRVSSTHRNASANKHVVPRNSLLFTLMSSRLYQYSIKPLIGRSMVDLIKSKVLPKPKVTAETLSETTLQTLTERLANSAGGPSSHS